MPKRDVGVPGGVPDDACRPDGGDVPDRRLTACRRAEPNITLATLATADKHLECLAQPVSQHLAFLGMATSEALKGHLDPLVLAILESRPLHGYAVIEELRQRSGGSFDLPEGTVYPALHRLERAGLTTSESHTVGGRVRRIYQLTRRGRRALGERRNDWRSFSATVSAILQAQPV